MLERERDRTPRQRPLANFDLSLEAWAAQPHLIQGQQVCHLEGWLGPLDAPRTPRRQLSTEQVRQLQSRLIELIVDLDNSAIESLLSVAVRQNRTNTLRTQIQQKIDAAIQYIRDHPDTPAGSLTFPQGAEPLPASVVTRIREYISNENNTALTNLRNELVQTALQSELPAALRERLRQLLTAESRDGTFGNVSRATFNRICAWIRQQVIDTLQKLDDRMLAFPPGCPVEPPLNPISNRHVSNELFRAMIRRMRPGEPGTDITFQMPTLAGDAVPTPLQMSRVLNALTWLRDADELVAPIQQESRRQALSTLITRFNRPGWGRDRYSNDEQWEARAGALVDLELQMRRCAELILLLRRKFPNFPLHGVVGGSPAFPGEIEVRNGRLHRIVPELPETLELTLENRRRIERCREWLRQHGTRVDQQLARLFGATDNQANIFMLGDVEPAPGQPRTIGGRTFNLITFDIEVVDNKNGTYRVTPITRYRNSPWYNYLNRIVDGTVYRQNGTTEVLRADDLVLVNRQGSFELMTVADLQSWRRSHVFWGGVRDGVTAAVDLSMIVLGGVEMKAAWTATAQLAARSGMGAARSYMMRTLALRRGGMHLLLGGSGILSSAHFGDPDVSILGVSGEHLRTARHYAFLIDGGLQIAGKPSLAALGSHRAISSGIERVIASRWWLRIPHRVAGNPALPMAMVGLGLANIFGMFRNAGQDGGDTINVSEFADARPRAAFIESSMRHLLRNADFSTTDINRLLGIVADNRPPQQPPQRRLAVEQSLVAEFNRQGATEKQKLAAAALLLIEAARNSAEGTIPAHLGQTNSGIASQTVKDYVLGRFQNSSNPEIRLQAAQVLVATNQITGQEFAAFCMTIARSATTSKSVRMQAIVGVSMSMILAGAAEAELARLVQSGQATSADASSYLVDSFGVTKSDLRTFLRSIATRSEEDRDLRALSAAILHLSNHGSFRDVMTRLQELAGRWRAAANQPAGSFATGTIAELALDLSLPVTSGDSQAANNARKLFNAATTLQMLGNEAFAPVSQVPRFGIALTVNPDAGFFGAVQPLSALNPGNALTPQGLNDALITCVSPASPEIAVQALRQLLPGIASLTNGQVNRLREAARQLLARLTLPNQGVSDAPVESGLIDGLGALFRAPALAIGMNNILDKVAEQEQQTRIICRQQLIEMLPELFLGASDMQRNRIVRQLGATLRPEGAMLATDTPELRRAAAIAIGRLIEGRPVARSFVGKQTGFLQTDVLSPLLGGPVSPVTLLNQNSVLNDPSPIGRLEAALTYDSAPLVRMAALEALLRANPATLANGKTLQEVCTQLLETETDPAVLELLRRAEFVHRSIDPTSPDYLDEFQRARRDLLQSLNCRGDKSLAGIPEFIFQHCSTSHTLTHTPNYNQPYHNLNHNALRTMAEGNGPHSMNALKALAYMIVSNGRPFELGTSQFAAVWNSVNTLFHLCRGVNPNTNPQKARDILWALELCLVLQPNLASGHRHTLLESYMHLVGRMPADPALRQRAAVVVATVLQRDFVSWRPNNALQLACIRYLETYKTRAALPVLELIARTNRNGPVRTAGRALLEELRTDPDVVGPGTIGGPRRGQVAFDDAYEHLQRQLIDQVNGLFAPPGVPINGPVIPDITEVPGNTPERRALLRGFANGTWFVDNANVARAPQLQFIWWNSHQYPAQGGQRNPELGFTNLLALARADGSTAPELAQRNAERKAQREARLALAWIVAVNGEGLVHSKRDDFVRRAAACLAELSARSMEGLADLDTVLESTLMGQPLMSQDRTVRNHLITALWNRRQSNGGSISNAHVALILAGALRSEYQTMPRPDEPGFTVSRDMQISILQKLEQLGHKMCAPVVEALALHHPVVAVRTRAEQTLLALNDNVWRVWNRTVADTTTSLAARTIALRNALAGNGAHDGVVQAIFNAYKGKPIIANNTLYRLYLSALSDRRDYVRLATALVVLRSENTAFTVADKRRAMTVAADAALHGVHIGLRNSARQILLDNLTNGTNTVEPVPGRSITITRNSEGLTLVESTNGRVTAVLLPNGKIRRFFYDSDNRLTRYISDDNTEYTVVQRSGNQLTWSNGRGYQFVSEGNAITAAGAVGHGIQFRISRITYPNGVYREFGYTGSTLTHLRDAAGREYDRVRLNGAWTDIWTINGDPDNIWVGTVEANNEGIYREYSPHLGSERTVNPDGTESSSRSARTLNLGSGRQLIIESNGRVVVKVNGEYANLTVSLGEGRELQQFAHGASFLREDGRLIQASYPEGSSPPMRRFEYRNGHLSRMIFQRTGQASPTISTRQFTDAGQPTNSWQIAGPTFNATVTGTLTNTNGDYLWVGTNGWQEAQSFATGESVAYNTR